MGNLLPAERHPNKNSATSAGRSGREKRPPQARKRREQPAEVGLSKNLTAILAVIVIILSFAVAFFAVQINTLKTSNREKDLEITRLTNDMEILKDAQQENETVTATVNYAEIPENPGPETADGSENPGVAEVQKFNFEELFARSSTMISSAKKLSYYICNDKAALRLIEDSGLEYVISKSSGNYYNVLLIGSYEPDWVKELSQWEERKKQLLATIVASSTENSTDTAVNTFKMPEELNGLEASRQDYGAGIQLLSTPSEEEISKIVWKLRNEEIPAYIYSYPINFSNKSQYTLQIDIFPNRKKAVEYLDILKSDFRDLYLTLIERDITGSYPREIFDYTK